MCDYVETDLWINVEECFEENSYWMPTPPEEADECDEVGIIEIDVNAPIFMKIVSLMHEVGHYLLDQDDSFGKDVHTIFKESMAWYLGFKHFKALGFNIDYSDYEKETNRALDLYIRSMS